MKGGGTMIQIVSEVPGGLRVRRLGRALVVILGVVLVAATLVAAIYPLVFAAAIGYGLVTGTADTPKLSAKNTLIVAAVTAGWLLLLWVGLRMIRGRRRLGLYLRKFGFADTTRTVSHALSSAVGRSLRLVTLDDSVVAPLGAGKGRRWLGGVFTVLAIATVGWVLYYLFGGAFARYSDEISHSGRTPTSLGDAIGQGIGQGLAIAFALLLVILLGTIGLIIGALFGGVYVAARRAEKGASQTLTDERSIEVAAGRLARASRRTLAARLVVVAVPTAFWQKAVHGLAAVSDVVIIDVSHPTDNLLWEVRNIKPLFHGRWVLVGARDLVVEMQTPETFASHTPMGVLARMLDGEQVLVYGTERADRRRFARSLRRTLEQVRRLR